MIEKRIAELKKQIERHNYLYYVKDSPAITDFEYDALMSELKKLEEFYIMPTMIGLLLKV